MLKLLRLRLLRFNGCLLAVRREWFGLSAKKMVLGLGCWGFCFKDLGGLSLGLGVFSGL